jgi:hypothetical protein
MQKLAFVVPDHWSDYDFKLDENTEDLRRQQPNKMNQQWSESLRAMYLQGKNILIHKCDLRMYGDWTLLFIRDRDKGREQSTYSLAAVEIRKEELAEFIRTFETWKDPLEYRNAFLHVSRGRLTPKERYRAL